ncbi:hypothetical protein [Colwellia sp. E2M01]|uniref:hypothetical protein n=1 Tax=Colwellia sp. E2M01 TaxID=2841561 RepID=UPI001C092780|nr:hypothetical protein [Colwellia sp. E2M01]MBU2870236.1 hypothetical protein [Colwellia sp. E2M01]
MLLLFCITLFAHSEHYTQAKSEPLPEAQHDCHFCQQNLDDSSGTIELSVKPVGIISWINTKTPVNPLIASNYLLPNLRAPPVFPSY